MKRYWFYRNYGIVKWRKGHVTLKFCISKLKFASRLWDIWLHFSKAVFSRGSNSRSYHAWFVMSHIWNVMNWCTLIGVTVVCAVGQSVLTYMVSLDVCKSEECKKMGWGREVYHDKWMSYNITEQGVVDCIKVFKIYTLWKPNSWRLRTCYCLFYVVPQDKALTWEISVLQEEYGI